MTGKTKTIVLGIKRGTTGILLEELSPSSPLAVVPHLSDQINKGTLLIRKEKITFGRLTAHTSSYEPWTSTYLHKEILEPGTISQKCAKSRYTGVHEALAMYCPGAMMISVIVIENQTHLNMLFCPWGHLTTLDLTTCAAATDPEACQQIFHLHLYHFKAWQGNPLGTPVT